MLQKQALPTPASPRRQTVVATSDAEWELLCEITAYLILRKGFNFEHLSAETRVQIGGELGTGVVLVVSAGTKPIYNVRHTEPGVAEGLKYMAQDGLAGRMILYGLGFQFVPAHS